jgi:hypothetical protein
VLQRWQITEPEADNRLTKRRVIMEAKPTKIPSPDKVASPDPEPVGVEFLAELPEHVRAFFDEQRKSGNSQ